MNFHDANKNCNIDLVMKLVQKAQINPLETVTNCAELLQYNSWLDCKRNVNICT